MWPLVDILEYWEITVEILVIDFETLKNIYHLTYNSRQVVLKQSQDLSHLIQLKLFCLFWRNLVIEQTFACIKWELRLKIQTLLLRPILFELTKFPSVFCCFFLRFINDFCGELCCLLNSSGLGFQAKVMSLCHFWWFSNVYHIKLGPVWRLK